MIIVVVYIAISIVLLGFLAAYLSKRREKKLRGMLERGEISEMPQPVEVDDECCGSHEVCEKDSLLAAVSKDIVYYDDEELDRFMGKPSNSYDTPEIEEFTEILYTLKSDEVAGWVRSLQLRYIELPDEIKDEVFLIVGERRH